MSPPEQENAHQGPVRGIGKWVPGLATARGYRLGYLRHDLVAGLVLTALLIPAGMGYAEAAGLPAINGLYATMVPLIAYALFGPSRILVVGPDSAIVPLIAAVVVPLASADPARRVAVAGLLAVVAGLVCVAAGVGRLGFITDLLSKPVRYGYINGLALIVLVSQLPKLVGFSVAASQSVPRVWEVIRGVLDGRAQPAALALGAGSLALILVLKRVAPRVPGVLIAVVLATVVVAELDLAQEGVSVVGQVPRGLPAFALPVIHGGDFWVVFAGALGIALVAFADTSVISRTFAVRGGYEVDPNRELVALGVANAAAGLFQGFPISSSASRTPVAESAGAKTQLTGIVGAVAIAVLIIFAPWLLQDLPSAALGAVVIGAALGLVEIKGIRRLFQERRSEFYLALATFLAVTVLGVLQGIAVAVGLSLLNFIRLAWRPHDAVLGRVTGLKGYHDTLRFPEAKRIPGLAIYRFDAPLFFANAEFFGAEVRRLATGDVTPTRWVLVAAEPITDLDSTAADMLEELYKDLAAAGVELVFAELKDPVKDRFERYGLNARLGPRRFFPTLGDAIHAYVRETGVEWTDWKDQPPDDTCAPPETGPDV
jgi:high affinity sulfate transporter 1